MNSPFIYEDYTDVELNALVRNTPSTLHSPSQVVSAIVGSEQVALSVIYTDPTRHVSFLKHPLRKRSIERAWVFLKWLKMVFKSDSWLRGTLRGMGPEWKSGTVWQEKRIINTIFDQFRNRHTRSRV